MTKEHSPVREAVVVAIREFALRRFGPASHSDIYTAAGDLADAILALSPEGLGTFTLETGKLSPSYTIPMILACPRCGERHIDEADFAEVAHHTHACQSCGVVWRPAKVNTHGVDFLPGYRNAAPSEATTDTRDRGRLGAEERLHVEAVNTCEMPEVAQARFIEELRADEGDNIAICCDDPEAFDPGRRVAVDCIGAWTDWSERRFYGESVLQCLARAVTARQQSDHQSTGVKPEARGE